MTSGKAISDEILRIKPINTISVLFVLLDFCLLFDFIGVHPHIQGHRLFDVLASWLGDLFAQSLRKFQYINNLFAVSIIVFQVGDCQIKVGGVLIFFELHNSLI